MKKQGKKEIATKILGKNVLSNVYGGKYLISNYMHDGKPVSDS